MEQPTPEQETRAPETAPRRPGRERRAQGGDPAYPDRPEAPDDDDDDAGGYPGINRPEMPSTDRENVERPEKAPNPMNDPDGQRARQEERSKEADAGSAAEQD